MVALNYLSHRLGIAPSKLINDEPTAWARIEADLALACGRWDDAIDAYDELLGGAGGRTARAELLSGRAEALVRRGRGREAVAAAAEAAELFHAADREPEAAIAEYWLAAAQYQLENSTESKALLNAILVRVRAGLKVEPGFQLRLVMALSTNESRDGNHATALAYLEEVRGLEEALDDRRRAQYLHDLAYSYRETGDFEAAVRAGLASLELFRRVNAEREAAGLQNDLALSYLALGNTSRAGEIITSARTVLERLGDDWWLAHILDTQAQIALARGDVAEAVSQSAGAIELADLSHNSKAMVDALLTHARALSSQGDPAAAMAAFERAGRLARESGSASLIRHALREWADALARAGQHEQAFAIMREALSAS
jgi:tetratricopeptide (TPR) repeat protein